MRSNSDKKPIFVAISDIHFNLNTLPVASAALKAALAKAEDLGIPLVIAGDLNDTKAIIRAEIMNAILEIISVAKTKVYVLRGNHDQISEKAEDHGLNYLKPFATIVDKSESIEPNILLVPYQTQGDNLVNIVEAHKGTKIVVCHQGFLGADMGDYIQDKTSITPDRVKNYQVISGHYHRHQTLGTVTYIGSPYTITFGEANDGPKGFLVVNSDGSFTREILGLRRHWILEGDVSENGVTLDSRHTEIKPGDLVRIKLKGSRAVLDKVDKDELYERCHRPAVFKIDKIYNDTAQVTKEDKKLSIPELFDKIIDNDCDSDSDRTYLKQLWREIDEN